MTIIVTGGTHGIGRACVENLTLDGRQVVFTGRDETAGQEIAAKHAGATFIAADVASEEDCRNVVTVAAKIADGRIDGLVNNAGMSRRVDFASASCADWDEIMKVNARSAFLFTNLALGALRRAGGSVVNIASVAGMVGEEGLALYCASKAAVIGMTQALALEYGDRVRFNCVCPGQIDTRMMVKVAADPLRKALLEARIPAGRFGAPAEIASIVAWLLSDGASYINGAVIAADGGETAGLRTPRAAPKPD